MVVKLLPYEVPESRLWIAVDDNGEGGSMLDECNAENNELLIESWLCQ